MNQPRIRRDFRCYFNLAVSRGPRLNKRFYKKKQIFCPLELILQ